MGNWTPCKRSATNRDEVDGDRVAFVKVGAEKPDPEDDDVDGRASPGRRVRAG